MINYVLLPTYDDVTEIVVNSDDHGTLLAALSQANLVGTLQDPMLSLPFSHQQIQRSTGSCLKLVLRLQIY